MLSQLEENPEAAKPLVESLLKKKLEQDEELAKEMEQLINTNIGDGSSTGAQIMEAYIASIVDLRGADFRNAQGVEITGVKVGNLPNQFPTGPKMPKKGEGEEES